MNSREVRVKTLRSIGYFFSTLLIYLGVTLAGWGLGSLGSYFSDAPRLGYALVVGLFSLAAGFQAYYAPEGIRGGKGEESKFVFRQRILAIVLVYSMFLALFLVPFLSHRGLGVFTTPGWLRFIGLALSALGYGLIFYSGLALGKQYSADVTIQKDHQLITSGPYHLIRHPRYLGVVSLAFGMPLIFRSWVGLAAGLFFTALVLLRIRDEEIVMHNEFGLQWDAYCRQSWRLLPYLY